MDEISDLNLTSEYDHLALKRFELSVLPIQYSDTNEEKHNNTIKIIHSPTNKNIKVPINNFCN
jgi:hypothetical protein